ncbi:MAG: hypothetical protein WCK90_01715 [archaeon]
MTVNLGKQFKKELEARHRKEKTGNYFFPVAMEHGICFPTLKFVANQFAEKNGFNIKEEIDWVSGKKGLSVLINGGMFVLVDKYTAHGLTNLEQTLGGGPLESYRNEYHLFGKINKKAINLVAEISYSRGTRSVRKTIDCGVLGMNDVFKDTPTGEFSRNEYRTDNEKYWFVTRPRKS